MKKMNWIFIALAVIEILAMGYIYLDTFTLNPGCNSPCEFHPSFFQPFEPVDFEEPEYCISMCVIFLPASFFIVSYFLIATIMIYAVYLIAGARK